MKKYKAECSECKRVFEHEKELVVKQMLGYHKKVAHGIDGVSKDIQAKRVAAREAYWKKQGYSPERLASARAKYAAKQSAAPTVEGPVRKAKKSTDAVPLALTECPRCKARLYYTAQPKDSE